MPGEDDLADLFRNIPEKRPVLDKSRMASTEIPGKGEFFLYTNIEDDEVYGAGGSVWAIESRAVDILAQNGDLGDVLRDPKFKDAANPFMIAQGLQGPSPGLLIDYYNDPGSAHRDPFDESKGAAYGIVDILGNTSDLDPLRGSVSEMINGVIRLRTEQILRDNPDARTLTVINEFFDDTRHPNKAIEAVFKNLQYNATEVKESRLSEHTIKVTIPISR